MEVAAFGLSRSMSSPIGICLAHDEDAAWLPDHDTVADCDAGINGLRIG